MVLRPSPADRTPDLKHKQDQIMRGVCYESAMLWGAGSPHSEIVGPVTYMWRPFSRERVKLEPEEGGLSNSHCFDDESSSSLRRQLWIWIHPAALDEGLNAIRTACERQMQDSGGLVKCCSLEGKIARLEVMGCKALQSLKSTLHPVINSSMTNKLHGISNMSTTTDAPPDSSTGSILSKASIIDHAEILQPGAILSMIVHDPREVSVQGTDSSSKLVSLNKENKLLEEGHYPNADETSSEVENILSSMWMHPGRHDLFLSECRELWGSSHNINPPLAEEILCMEKHHEHIKFFCLDSGNEQRQRTQENDSFSRSCPIILLKHAKEGMLTPG
uniref:POPLD domain-containing protein n=1 Tax=Arundo donax TaxID=35708 RepID=A0A0A9D7L5_ARUDO